MAKQYDLIIIGAGIIGLATGYHYLKAHPRAKLLILEKETAPAQHQTGRNSGVVHAGVYYAPNTIKARFCQQGRMATARFCQQHRIPYEARGKLLVATNDVELERMAQLQTRAVHNGLTPEPISAAKLSQLEKGIIGKGALFIKESAITDYKLICHCLCEHIVSMGGAIRFGVSIRHLEEANSVRVSDGAETYQASKLIACAGIHSDRLITALGLKPPAHMVPFRGEYYRINRSAGLHLKRMIYPIPNPDLPFLGVHLTPMVGGAVTAGPNAIMAMQKEGYQRSVNDVWGALARAMTPGVLPFAYSHKQAVLQELATSLFKSCYVKQVQQYAPHVTQQHLQAYPAGIRAQAIKADGTLVDDFLFVQTPHCMIVVNAPSPAATSSFPIAQHILNTVFGNDVDTE